MHVLFVHKNYPAQFGHIARYLVRDHGCRVTYVSNKEGNATGKFTRIRYEVKGGATKNTHFHSRTFENATWHAAGVYEALKARREIRPDVIVGHSGFGSTLFLRELYDAPIINYFEYFYRPTGSEMDFRPDFPSIEAHRLRARARNAMILSDLENCDLGYSPTEWQRDRFPARYRDDIRVIFDGVDTGVWHPGAGTRQITPTATVPEGQKVITYATRGMESMRGFDIFMRFAKRLADRRDDVVFLVAGEDRVAYGGDERFTGGKSFRQWVIDQDDYDLTRFRFLGLIPPSDLANLFRLSDLHVYLTVPFVLSWSLMNALACGTTILASDVGPVREMITDGHNGLLVDFFDVDAMVERAVAVLDAPGDYRQLGEAGAAMVDERYGIDVCLPKMLDLYADAAGPDTPAG